MFPINALFLLAETLRAISWMRFRLPQGGWFAAEHVPRQMPWNMGFHRNMFPGSCYIGTYGIPPKHVPADFRTPPDTGGKLLREDAALLHSPVSMRNIFILA